MDSAVWKPQLTLLDGAKIETLHQAATAILARTGLNVHHPELRRRLTGAGAGLGAGERVTIPAEMVSQALSLESLVLAAEQIRWVKQFVDGFEMSPEALALEVIDEVGPAGDFMGHDHTLEHFRQQMWTPYVVTRASYEDWAEAGALDYMARARDYAKQLVDSHQPLPLDASLDRQLRELCGLVG